ncbi:MAG: hypothetical protein K2G90_02730 [Muribaculaceae bacterium]|nr:hypothetical protein [Muribaculaceae bacterium]
MKYIQFFLVLAIMTFAGLDASAKLSRQPEADALRATLKPGMTPKDSIDILFNVFDLADQKNKSEIGWKILDIAQRSKNYEVLYDMLPQVSSLHIEEIEPQEKLIAMANKLPDGDKKKAVVCFLKVNKATVEGSYLTPEERHAHLVKYLKEDITQKDDVYQNFLDLYRVVVFLGLSHDGSMYMEYLERLEKMIDEIPETGFAFPSRFYTTAANFYSRNGYYEKAIEMDRQLLKLISQLETYYAKQGRKYRNYDRFKYLCYRRMLSNYPALTDAEVEEYYAKCKELAQKNEELNTDFHQYRLADAPYLMAKKRYPEAVVALQEALNHVRVRATRYVMLSRLKEAADSTNNKEVLLSALQDYNNMLEDKLKANAEGTMLELRMRYEVKKIEEARRQAEEEKHVMELESDEKLISLALIAVFVLAVVLMFLYRSHFSLIHKSRDLKADNQKLHDTIEEMLISKGNIPGTEDLLHPSKKITDNTSEQK